MPANQAFKTTRFKFRPTGRYLSVGRTLEWIANFGCDMNQQIHFPNDRDCLRYLNDELIPEALESPTYEGADETEHDEPAMDAVSDLLEMETIGPSDIDRCRSLLEAFFESRGMDVSTTKSLEVAFSGVAGCLGRLEPRRSARWREFTRLNDNGALDPQDPNHLALVEALANESRDPEGQNVVLECFAVRYAKASA